MLRSFKQLLGAVLGLFLAACATTGASLNTHPRLVELERLKQERGWTFDLKYTEVLERPLPKRIPLRTMSSRQSREQTKAAKAQLASASKTSNGPWRTRGSNTPGQLHRDGGVVDPRGLFAR